MPTMCQHTVGRLDVSFKQLAADQVSPEDLPEDLRTDENVQRLIDDVAHDLREAIGDAVAEYGITLLDTEFLYYHDVEDREAHEHAEQNFNQKRPGGIGGEAISEAFEKVDVYDLVLKRREEMVALERRRAAQPARYYAASWEGCGYRDDRRHRIWITSPTIAVTGDVTDPINSCDDEPAWDDLGDLAAWAISYATPADWLDEPGWLPWDPTPPSRDVSWHEVDPSDDAISAADLDRAVRNDEHCTVGIHGSNSTSDNHHTRVS